jgi:hypothetical protein
VEEVLLQREAEMALVRSLKGRGVTAGESVSVLLSQGGALAKANTALAEPVLTSVIKKAGQDITCTSGFEFLRMDRKQGGSAASGGEDDAMGTVGEQFCIGMLPLGELDMVRLQARLFDTWFEARKAATQSIEEVTRAFPADLAALTEAVEMTKADLKSTWCHVVRVSALVLRSLHVASGHEDLKHCSNAMRVSLRAIVGISGKATLRLRLALKSPWLTSCWSAVTTAARETQDAADIMQQADACVKSLQNVAAEITGDDAAMTMSSLRDVSRWVGRKKQTHHGK